jgi:DedD protein
VQPVDAARFVVQVGAFAESGRAQDVRQKIERAGLKTYTQVAQTKDGPRIRVRVGPFGNKAEAEQAAEQIRKLNLPTAILSL